MIRDEDERIEGDVSERLCTELPDDAAQSTLEELGLRRARHEAGDRDAGVHQLVAQCEREAVEECLAGAPGGAPIPCRRIARVCWRAPPRKEPPGRTMPGRLTVPARQVL